MSYSVTSFRKLTSDPRAQVWPCTQFAYFNVTNLAASGTQTIEVQDTPFAAHTEWLLGAFNVLSFAVNKNQYGGAIRLEINAGNAAFDQAFMFPLTGEDIVDTLTGFEIGGFSARFVFVNGLGGPTTAYGWIQLRSW